VCPCPDVLLLVGVLHHLARAKCSEGHRIESEPKLNGGKRPSCRPVGYGPMCVPTPRSDSNMLPQVDVCMSVQSRQVQ